ncbi:DEAD-box ATP-dependent RNA helicase 52A-like [Humulus lupulus]|uniref:DEAD-box ATP-dependent RNA helicase 52A-like n=1 Tax=Humulus lupulus TaxID=3486 RepID=UPI002B4150B1|nr:DEAD-box ATP-dependent RNA helicase 52A-like [Humulus lupulus]
MERSVKYTLTIWREVFLYSKGFEHPPKTLAGVGKGLRLSDFAPSRKGQHGGRRTESEGLEQLFSSTQISEKLDEEMTRTGIELGYIYSNPQQPHGTEGDERLNGMTKAEGDERQQVVLDDSDVPAFSAASTAVPALTAAHGSITHGGVGLGSSRLSGGAGSQLRRCRFSAPAVLVAHGSSRGLRELAQQIEKEVKAFSKSLESFKTAIVVGGTNISDQRSELRAGVDIVVATPGRFIDHLQQGNSSLSRVSFVVLDEADRMLDMGFEPQIREVMRSLPEKHQTLLFSATMTVEIEALTQEYLSSPVQVKVGKVSSPTANVCQNLVKVPNSEKVCILK